MNYHLIYSFMSPPDGLRPLGGLTVVDGAMWTTTSLGGVGQCATGLGCGTVVKDEGGQESVVYRFKGGADGSTPAAGLTLFDGKLYGTLSRGGDRASCPDFSCGAVFEISTSGDERLVYSFKGGKDAAGPYGGLVAVGGALYGTTARGGDSEVCGDDIGCGTVFRVTPDGKEQVLHSFANSPDGAVPLGGLTVVDGVLYGTTQQGGKNGRGAVYSMIPVGKESVVYSFKASPDGGGPVQDLTTSDRTPGVLYGITQNGGITGTKSCADRGCGTVFSVNTAGKEAVLYRFKGGPDGTHPYANVTVVGGVIYGTTGLGGIESCDTGNGCGTIFKLQLSGAGYRETTLYDFTIPGTYPQSGFTRLNGMLYGTSKGGGRIGIGSIYAFTP